MTNKTAEGARLKAIELDLERPPIFDTLTEQEFESIYNGIGPDSWCDELRACMTFIYRNFRTLPAVHDVCYAYSDGTRETWELVTQQWTRNTHKCLDNRYPLHKPWLWPLRMIAWVKLQASIQALEHFSYGAYVTAHSIRKA